MPTYSLNASTRLNNSRIFTPISPHLPTCKLDLNIDSIPFSLKLDDQHCQSLEIVRSWIGEVAHDSEFSMQKLEFGNSIEWTPCPLVQAGIHRPRSLSASFHWFDWASDRILGINIACQYCEWSSWVWVGRNEALVHFRDEHALESRWIGFETLGQFFKSQISGWMVFKSRQRLLRFWIESIQSCHRNYQQTGLAFDTQSLMREFLASSIINYWIRFSITDLPFSVIDPGLRSQQ